MWPVAILAFGLAAPEKTIHYRGNFREDGNGAMFRNQKELSIGGRAGDYLQDVGGSAGKTESEPAPKKCGAARFRNYGRAAKAVTNTLDCGVPRPVT